MNLAKYAAIATLGLVLMGIAASQTTQRNQADHPVWENSDRTIRSYVRLDGQGRPAEIGVIVTATSPADAPAQSIGHHLPVPLSALNVPAARMAEYVSQIEPATSTAVLFGDEKPAFATSLDQSPIVATVASTRLLVKPPAPRVMDDRNEAGIAKAVGSNTSTAQKQLPLNSIAQFKAQVKVN